MLIEENMEYFVDEEYVVHSVILSYTCSYMCYGDVLPELYHSKYLSKWHMNNIIHVQISCLFLSKIHILSYWTTLAGS